MGCHHYNLILRLFVWISPDDPKCFPALLNIISGIHMRGVYGCGSFLEGFVFSLDDYVELGFMKA
jgi:hypothetical protein